MLQFSADHKVVEHIYREWRRTVAKDVERLQRHMVMGNGKDWCEVEVDEVTVAKRLQDEIAGTRPWPSHQGVMETHCEETFGKPQNHPSF